MRDYLSPAKKIVERVIPHPAAARAFIMKRRALVFAMAAASIFVLTLGVITVRAITAPKAVVEHTVTSEGKTSTLSTSSNDSKSKTEEQPAMNQQSSTSSNNTAGSSSESKTTVTINNEQVPLPPSGNVQRTITDDNGTTQVNVSTNTDSSGNSYTSSFMTTNSNSSSINNSTITSNSQNVNITTQ